MNDKHTILMLYVPCPDEVVAGSIATRLLELKLVACTQIFPVKSSYWWENGIQQDAEWILVAKTRQDLERQTEAAVLHMHPYETACVLRWDVRVNASYAAWVAAETTQAHQDAGK
jgi:periplasmic divalent cation tolerance protein